MQIVKKTIVPYKGEVHDLQMRNDPSYNVEGIKVHNSAAGSLVSYLLNIVQVDPLEYDLLFSRFLNEARVGGSLPDIDLDVSSVKRGDIKRHVEEKYGVDYVASIGTYGTFKIRAAIKDILREIGGDAKEANYVSAIIEGEDSFNDLFKKALEPTVNKRLKKFIQKHALQIDQIPLLFGQQKNASIHAAGVVIAPKYGGIIQRQLPTKHIDGIMVTEWEGGLIEKAGFLKVDLLGLKQLDKFQDIISLIEENRQIQIKLADIKLDEADVYEFFQKGFNEDIFQFGGAGLKGYCKELLPENINDLIAMASLYRPGPIEIGAHTKYARIKNGFEEPEYDFGTEEITKPTYGLMVYQEQISNIAQKLGGLSPSEADDVRKAMGKKDAELMAKYKDRFIEGSVKNLCPRLTAENIWYKMEGFAAYAFNKCISGEEQIYRASQNKSGKSTYWPTIEEMFKIRQSYAYAKSIGKQSLHLKYKHKGYAHGFSLNEKSRLIKNGVKDIRLIGEREIYRVTTESGKTIDVTLNHKFPTNNGEKKLEDIDISLDQLYINIGFVPYDSVYRFGLEEGHNYPHKGEQGFRKKDTDYTKWRTHRDNRKTVCDECGKENCKIEIHHKDSDHGNNLDENVAHLCVSCHKKAEYKIGRTKTGQAGLHTALEKIKSIEFLKIGNVYDVEMEHPYHTFAVKSGIVTSNSHSTCYAITGYYSQWLKVKYPLEFWLVSLKYTDQKDMQARISEIKAIGSGIDITGPDVLKSRKEYYGDTKTNKIYWALNSISYVSEAATEEIMKLRDVDKRFFADFEDFYNLIQTVKVEKKGALQEGERMRSPINKRVLTNLIIVGAFDELEKIGPTTLWKRGELLKKLYELSFPELKLEPFSFTSEKWKKRMTEELMVITDYKFDYQWIMAQKKLCGFGDLNFKELMSKVGLAAKADKFRTNNEVNATELKYDRNEKLIEEDIVVGGVVQSIIERKSKNGPFAQLLLHDGEKELYITVWNEIYDQFKTEIDNSGNKILFIDGIITFDKYKNSNVIHSKSYSIVKILN